jgi:hypothetical protein
MTKLMPCGLFHTPKDLAEIDAWIALHPAEDRVHLMTAAYMTWNLCCKLTEGNEENEDA